MSRAVFHIGTELFFSVYLFVYGCVALGVAGLQFVPDMCHENVDGRAVLNLKQFMGRIRGQGDTQQYFEIEPQLLHCSESTLTVTVYEVLQKCSTTQSQPVFYLAVVDDRSLSLEVKKHSKRCDGEAAGSVDGWADPGTAALFGLEEMLEIAQEVLFNGIDTSSYLGSADRLKFVKQERALVPAIIASKLRVDRKSLFTTRNTFRWTLNMRLPVVLSVAVSSDSCNSTTYYVDLSCGNATVIDSSPHVDISPKQMLQFMKPVKSSECRQYALDVETHMWLQILLVTILGVGAAVLWLTNTIALLYVAIICISVGGILTAILEVASSVSKGALMCCLGTCPSEVTRADLFLQILSIFLPLCVTYGFVVVLCKVTIFFLMYLEHNKTKSAGRLLRVLVKILQAALCTCSCCLLCPCPGLMLITERIPVVGFFAMNILSGGLCVILPKFVSNEKGDATPPCQKSEVHVNKLQSAPKFIYNFQTLSWITKTIGFLAAYASFWMLYLINDTLMFVLTLYVISIIILVADRKYDPDLQL